MAGGDQALAGGGLKVVIPLSKRVPPPGRQALNVFLRPVRRTGTFRPADAFPGATRQLLSLLSLCRFVGRRPLSDGPRMHEHRNWRFRERRGRARATVRCCDAAPTLLKRTSRSFPDADRPDRPALRKRATQVVRGHGADRVLPHRRAGAAGARGHAVRQRRFQDLGQAGPLLRSERSGSIRRSRIPCPITSSCWRKFANAPINSTSCTFTSISCHAPMVRQLAVRTLTTQHGRLDLPDLAPFYGVFASSRWSPSPTISATTFPMPTGSAKRPSRSSPRSAAV